MNGSPELLEYFLVEATEYIDAIDQLVSSPQLTPETNAMLASSRALRGSSAMANAEAIVEIGTALEQISLRLRDTTVLWSPDLFHAIRSSVADLRALVRHVRIWSDEDEFRARAAAKTLIRFLPEETPRPAPASSEATTPVFVALQTAAIAAELDAFATSPENRRSLDDAVARTRTLRGIAGIGDYPPLSDVADGVERFARMLVPDAPPSTRETELFRSAAAVMRAAAEQLRTTGGFVPDEAGVSRYVQAATALEIPAPSPEPSVVRIESLFYGDTGPHLVAPQPPISESPAVRLHRELLTRSEHLRRLVGDARRAQDALSRQRAAAALRDALREAATLAKAFDAHQACAYFSDAAAAPELMGRDELDGIDSACGLAMAPFSSIDELERRLAVVQRAQRSTPRSTPIIAPRITPPFTAPATPPRTTPISSSSVPAPSADPGSSGHVRTETPSPRKGPPMEYAQAAQRATPQYTSSVSTTAQHAKPTPVSGSALKAMLTSGLNGLRALETEMLSEPVLFEEEIVAVDSLVYRGASALDRAAEIRDDLRARQVAPDAAQLEELFDLIDLARAG